MAFEWEEVKSLANARTRGLPFEIAMALFDGPTLESPDRRREYGERRIKAIGRAAGQVLVCVYTDRSAFSCAWLTGESAMPIVRRTRADLDLSKVDWKRVTATTDREIAKQIAADPDTAPVFSARELSRAKRVVPPPAAQDVRAIRRRLGLTQAQFAARYGFSVETIRNYEQGHRRPAGPARVLLKVIASEPDAVTRALQR